MANAACAEAHLPALFDQTKPPPVDLLRLSTLGREASHPPALGGRIRLESDAAALLEEAQREFDGLLGDSRQARKIASRHSFFGQQSYEVCAYRERQLRLALEFESKGEEHLRKKSRQTEIDRPDILARRWQKPIILRTSREQAIPQHRQ